MAADTPDYAALLTAALTEPGTLATCYSAMHRFSMGNRFLATMQLGEKIGPIATYPRWKELGRQVRKGEKAIALYMPVTCKAGKVSDRTPQTDNPEPTSEGSAEMPRTFTKFVLRNNWFSVHQTDPIPGMEQSTEPPTPGWDYAEALTRLGISETPYQMTDGNCQGYAVPAAGYQTVHEQSGDIPRVQMPDSTKARKVAADWREALRAFDTETHYRALADSYANRVWLGPEQFRRLCALRDVRRKAVSMTSQAGRLRTLTDGHRI